VRAGPGHVFPKAAVAPADENRTTREVTAEVEGVAVSRPAGPRSGPGAEVYADRGADLGTDLSVDGDLMADAGTAGTAGAAGAAQAAVVPPPSARRDLSAVLAGLVGLADRATVEKVLVQGARWLVGAREARLDLIGSPRSVHAVAVAPATDPYRSDSWDGAVLEHAAATDAAPVAGPWLSAPVLVAGRPYATLSVAGRLAGDSFTSVEESLLAALTVAGGTAVRGALRYEATRRREDAAATAVAAVAAAADPELSTQLLVRLARRATGAAVAVVAVPCGADAGIGEVLMVTAEDGGAGTAGRQVPIADAGPCAEVLSSGRPATAPEAASALLGDAAAGPVLVAPLLAGTRAIGVLMLARPAGAMPFDGTDLEVAGIYGNCATLAVQSCSVLDRERAVAIVAERERIAQDLHDSSMQRIFAAGLHLQTLSPTLAEADAARVASVVDELDQTVQEVRAMIVSLREPGVPDPA
jgi:signal transduction histidine kinase